MKSIIVIIKDITRPLRHSLNHLFMTADEKLAFDNRHSYSELDLSELNYTVNISENAKPKSHVIYTCITGDYDNLIQPTYYNSDYDYVCFTDNKEWIKKKQIGVWQIKPLVKTEFSNALNNRWHKTHPQELFPDYEDSIYIDGNIDILTDSLFRQIEEKQLCNIVIPMHFTRNCVYKEISHLKKGKKIQRSQLMTIKKFLLTNNFPKNYGLNENNVIYRKHAEKEVIEIMEEWWNMILNIAPRDQVSLPFVLWKHGLKPNDIGIKNIRIQPNDFRLYFGVHK